MVLVFKIVVSDLPFAMPPWNNSGMKFLSLLIGALLPTLVLAQTTQPVVVTVTPSTQPSQIPILVNVPATVIQINPAPTPAPTTRMAIGTNIDANDYTSGSARWADVTRQFSGWFGIAGNTVTTWDSNGYPLTISNNGQARAFTYLYGDYPPGPYAVSWTGGQNALTFTGGKVIGNVQPNGPNSWRGTVTFSNGDRCEVQQSGGVNNIHIISPDAVPGRAFRDSYLAKLTPYKVLRLMPMERVNGTGLPPVLHTTWSQRVTPDQWSQTSWEVALEYQAELCRETGCIPWVCIPYGADDDCIARTAQVFASFPLIYVEMGNENWNQGPAYQGNVIRNDAIAMGIYGTNDPNVAGARRAAELSARVGKIFKQTIGASHVRTVFGAQAAWDAWARDGLGWLKPGDVDCLAIAPYFQPVNWINNPTVPQVLASCDQWIDTVLVPGIGANVKAATAYGVPTVAYEGGQHLLPSVKAPSTEFQWSAELSPAEWAAYLADPYRQAQFDPGIGQTYDHLFRVERDAGIVLSCHFMTFGSWGRSGWWSLYQTPNSPEYPKSQALQRAISLGN